ncbi:MAG: protein RarD [Ponticaulis sp.]|nr:protein RarD [Ponticaulis sp.]
MTPDIRLGFAAGLGAYLIWGFLPVFFKMFPGVAPEDILAHRILWSMPTGIGLILIAGRWSEFMRLFKSRDILWLVASAFLIALNWLTYIWAIGQDRIMETSLGYFMNPLANIAVAAIFLSEKLRRVQWVAVSIAVLAVGAETFALGHLPWVSLVLCFSFCFYGVIRRRVQTDSRIGFTVEVLVLLPIVLLWFGVAMGEGRSTWGHDMVQNVLLVLAGPLTAIPLILFAIGAKRLRFSTIGIMQYIAPSLQFLCALAFGEQLTPQRMVTFALIWVALVIFSVDAYGNERRMRRAMTRTA